MAHHLVIPLSEQQRANVDRVYERAVRTGAAKGRSLEAWVYTLFEPAALTFKNQLDRLASRGFLEISWPKDQRESELWRQQHHNDPLPKEMIETARILPEEVGWDLFLATPEVAEPGAFIVRVPRLMLDWIQRGLALLDYSRSLYPPWVDVGHRWESLASWATESIVSAVEQELNFVNQEELYREGELIYGPEVHGPPANGGERSKHPGRDGKGLDPLRRGRPTGS